MLAVMKGNRYSHKSKCKVSGKYASLLSDQAVPPKRTDMDIYIYISTQYIFTYFHKT